MKKFAEIDFGEIDFKPVKDRLLKIQEINRLKNREILNLCLQEALMLTELTDLYRKTVPQPEEPEPEEPEPKPEEPEPEPEEPEVFSDSDEEDEEKRKSPTKAESKNRKKWKAWKAPGTFSLYDPDYPVTLKEVIKYLQDPYSFFKKYESLGYLSSLEYLPEELKYLFGNFYVNVPLWVFHVKTVKITSEKSIQKHFSDQFNKYLGKDFNYLTHINTLLTKTTDFTDDINTLTNYGKFNETTVNEINETIVNEITKIAENYVYGIFNEIITDNEFETFEFGIKFIQKHIEHLKEKYPNIIRFAKVEQVEQPKVQQPHKLNLQLRFL